MALKARSAQDFLPIKEIRNGVVVLRDGSLRLILMTSSLNFALKSGEEQRAILMQFQNFLNSLEFSTQIFLQSRKLDTRPYIATLEARLKDQLSDLMKIQTREYIDFVQSFVDDSNIMTKTFFIVVPYKPIRMTSAKGADKKDAEVDAIEEHRSQLEQRASIVESGLGHCGIRVAQLGTEEIVELFFKLFNPGEQDKPIQL